MLKVNSIIRLTAAVLFAVIIAVSCFLCMKVQAAEGQQINTDNSLSNNLESGIYKIKNIATGKFLSVYDLKTDKQGRVYTEDDSESDRQYFLVTKLGDGTYNFRPQSEGAEYIITYGESDGAGALPVKGKDAAQDGRFDIFKLNSGAVTIAPAVSHDQSLVLGISDEPSANGHDFAAFVSYGNAESQMWELIAAKPVKMTISNKSMRLKPYSVDKLGAAVYPDYITEKVVWISSDENVVMIDDDGSFCTLKPGTAVVTAMCGDLSVTCEITVSSEPTFSWFSQHNISEGGWDGEGVSKLSFVSGIKKYFMTDRYNQNSDWMDEGCLLTSIATVFRNMGATADGYDFRSGKTGGLLADPYTLALANTGNYGPTNGNVVLYGNPILVNYGNVGNRFKVMGKSLQMTVENGVTPAKIKSALDKNPYGIIVGMYNSKYEYHYIVITKCINPEESDPSKYRFLICDPAAYNAAEGDNVPFEESYSYVSLGYRMSSMFVMHIWRTGS